MSVKVTFEFANAEEAIVALGKIIGAPTTAAVPPAAPQQLAEKPARKPRADKGQPRDPYGPRNPEANAAGAGAPVGAQPQGAPAQSTPAQAPTAAPAAAAPQATPPAAPAAAAPTDNEVQAAVEKLFNAKGFDDCLALLSRFGVKRGKDLPGDQRANFIRRVDGVIAGEAI